MKISKPKSQAITVDDEAFVVLSSSDNLFRDFGHPNPEELQLKAMLAAQILQAIRERSLTQRQAAELTGLKAPDISNICNARLSGISVERLFLVLNRLGLKIEIRILNESEETAAITLAA